jgi:hypothetical protein
MANLPDICVLLKILSSEYQHMPAVKFFARLDLDQICRFLDGHYLKFQRGRVKESCGSDLICVRGLTMSAQRV